VLKPIERFVGTRNRTVRAAFDAALIALGLDPCAVPDSYRLTGPLEHAVCGVHLSYRNWRIAYTVNRAEHFVLVIFVDNYYASGAAPNDPWVHLHQLCDLVNPADDHRKPDCCDASLAPIVPLDDEYLELLDSRSLNGLKRKHPKNARD
jgi:hypothetical protein